MNLVGHQVVAALSGADPVTQLGAVLPDALHLIGARTPSSLPGALAAGVALHHRTDDGFHNDPWVVAEMAQLRERLTSLGVARGPARAAAHIAWEMQLDGVLDVLGLAHGWVELWGDPDPVIEVLHREHHRDWQDLRAHAARPAWPERYRDAAWVAERVVAILSRRPRLAIALSSAHLADVLESPDQTQVVSLLTRLT